MKFSFLWKRIHVTCLPDDQSVCVCVCVCALLHKAHLKLSPCYVFRSHIQQCASERLNVCGVNIWWGFKLLGCEHKRTWAPPCIPAVCLERCVHCCKFSVCPQARTRRLNYTYKYRRMNWMYVACMFLTSVSRAVVTVTKSGMQRDRIWCFEMFLFFPL